jgi:ubiquinone/menaquinone biosynthesis C-methylase UbiE
MKKLDGLTRPAFPDYDPWYVITGKRAETERERIAFSMAAFWDKSAAEYEPHHALADHEVWKQVLSGLIGENKDAKILDLATGTGMIANMLAEAGYTDVTGMDLSEGMMNIAIGHAAEKGLNVRYLYGNALETGLPDDCLDVVISSRLLWTLAEPENALREWLRILKPGGRIIAINELDDGAGIRTRSFTDSREYLKDVSPESFPFSDIDKEGIVETFTKCGVKGARAELMKGCRLESSDRENWFAFVGTKG